MKHEFKNIELGHCYKDKITGFTGRATSALVAITGCDQVALVRPGKDGLKGEHEWFDDKRLEPSSEFPPLDLGPKFDNGSMGTPPARNLPR